MNKPCKIDNFLYRHFKYAYHSLCFLKLSLSDKNQANVIKAFNSYSRYLDVFFNIDNLCYEHGKSDISN